jgi:hypothetical protein
VDIRYNEKVNIAKVKTDTHKDRPIQLKSQKKGHEKKHAQQTLSPKRNLIIE